MLTPEQQKQIQALSDSYFKYKSQGDSAGMKSANDSANSIRQSAGQQAQVSNVDIADVQSKYTPQTITQPVQPQYDIMGEIERIKNANLASRSAALQALRDNTKSSLQTEKATIKPMYYDKRNDESSSSQLRAKKLTEMMASKGYSEGANAQAEISTNNALQGNIGLLKRQEQGAYDDIARRNTDADIAYNNGLQQAQADADTSAAEQRLAEIGTLRNYGREDTRNAIEDTRYTDETTYNRTQDEIERQDRLNDMEWERSSNNPAYKAQLLQNEILELQRGSMPQQIKDEAAIVQLQLHQGRIDLDTAKEELRRLKKTPISGSGGSGSSKGLTANQTLAQNNNTAISNMTNWIYNVPTTEEALNRARQNKASIISQLIEAGYEGNKALEYYNGIIADLQG